MRNLCRTAAIIWRRAKIGLCVQCVQISDPWLMHEVLAVANQHPEIIDKPRGFPLPIYDCFDRVRLLRAHHDHLMALPLLLCFKAKTLTRCQEALTLACQVQNTIGMWKLSTCVKCR